MRGVFVHTIGHPRRWVPGIWSVDLSVQARQARSPTVRNAPWVFVCSLYGAGLVGLFGLEMLLLWLYRPSDHPVRMLLSPAAIGGLVALGIVTIVTGSLRRPIVAVDLVRIGAWVLVGCSQGLGAIAGGYYAAYWPQHVSTARAVSWAMLLCSVVVILLTAQSVPVPQAPRPGCCPKCGYSLTGNDSGVSPECGTPAEGDGSP